MPSATATSTIAHSSWPKPYRDCENRWRPTSTGDGLDRTRVLAAAVRLLELRLFRVGNEEYASDNTSYGLTTLQKRHVRAQDDQLVFDYPAKSGQRRKVSIHNPQLVPVVDALKRRRRGGSDLLAYKDERGRWTDVRADDVNDYLRDVLGDEFSSKDVRTWIGTVLAAMALADRPDPASSTATQQRAEAQAMQQVARKLGNTPAVARSAYVDARLIENYEDGTTIEPDAETIEDAEPAVIELLDDS